MKVFYNLILSFWVCATKYAQTTQNKKFVNLCNISRKSQGEVDILPANKHESCLQVNSITLGLLSQACPKYPKE